MPVLHLLGTGAALSDPHRTTTMLALTYQGATLVVDCGGDVIQRLLAAGIDPDTITGLIVTHEHPDHVSGFPLFMEKIWLGGRRRPIPVYGIHSAIDQARRCFETFNTKSWTGMPKILWNEVALEEGVKVLEDAAWRVTATPGDHGVPVIALRFDHGDSGHSVTYSCDTTPSEKVARLAHGTNILVHEATGEGPWHSSADEAARIAAQAGAQQLLLVHLPLGLSDETLKQARSTFAETYIGEELGQYEL
jgi:ribonuclease Z